MKATLWTKVDLMIFLDKDDDIIGYQIDPSSLQRLKIVMPLYSYPSDTKKTLTIKDIYTRIVYEKDKIDNEEATLESFELNDSKYFLYSKINHQMKDAIPVNVEEPENTTEIDDDGSECVGFCPLNPTITTPHAYTCVQCANKKHCFTPF